ncbi:hypothetical protein EHM76_02575 [bacterium]|nr:MAG: hypothetical protein EHM76_02575 [bacterium]
MDPQDGHHLFLSINFPIIQAGDPLWHWPYGPDPVPYGPEQITNGGFDGAPPWLIVGGWNISGGSSNYLDFVNSRFYQNLTLLPGLPYKLEFDIINAPGLARMLFADRFGNPLFIAPYNGYTDFFQNHYNIIVTTGIARTTFAVYGNTAGLTFSIDNISLKQIF